MDKFPFEIELKVQADATSFIKKLAENTVNICLDYAVEEWLKQCQIWKREYPILLEDFKIDMGAVNPYFFIDTLSSELSDDDVVIPGSSGAGIDVFWLAIRNKRNQRMLATGSLGSMGYGIPAAIGACLAAGKGRFA